MPAAGAVLVTGTSKGIGRACVLDLHARGFRVFAGVRTDADAEALRTAADDRLVPLLLDVTRPADIAAAGDLLRSRVGPEGLWGLVNNAGMVVAGPIEYLPPQELRRQFDVNVFGTLELIQTCLPLLRAARGRIVNVSSVNGRVVTPFTGAYGASKFALEALSDALRLELRRTGVRVVVVQPGAIRTPLWETAPEHARRLAERYPPAALSHYGRVLERLAQVRVPSRALSAERVAAVIARALLARHPRARYHVGGDARVGIMAARLLPPRLLDALLTRRW
jgi:NAD(P)-dependent dehydrogenase (short-subunit alcohol dehydrogenase family)